MKTELTQYEDEYLERMKVRLQHDAELRTDAMGRERPRSFGASYGHVAAKFTDQTGKDECDINTIMNRVIHHNGLDDLIAQGMSAKNGMLYGDFSDAPSFQQALDIANHSKDQFSRLDAVTRARFDNDPFKFLQFMDDPNTKEQQVEMGLRPKFTQKEPDTTLKDVATAIREAAKPPKRTPKGEDTND